MKLSSANITVRSFETVLHFVPFFFQVFGNFVKIDPMLSLAICIDSDTNVMWKKRDPEDIMYNNPLLDTDMLFPEHLDPMDEQWSERFKQEMDEGKNSDDDDYGGGGDDDLDDGAIMDRDEDPDYKPMKRQRKIKMDPDSEYSRPLAPTGKRRGRPPKSGGAGTSNTFKSVRGGRIKKEGQFECGKCGRKYISATSLYSHMEKKCKALKEINSEFAETDEGKFLCRFADCVQGDDPFGTKEELDVHWADEHVAEEEKFIPCVLCERRFATPAAKKNHLKTSHVKPYKCDQCDRSFSVKENLQYHMANHAEIGLPGTVAAGTEKKKIKLEDPSKERYLCLKCGQTVAQSHGKKHEARCTGMHVRHPEYKMVGEEFWCTVDGCNIGYGFNSVYGLRKHFHGVHVRDEEKYFACDYCDERFSFLTTKNKHMTMKHIKPHICDICGKGFGFKNKLHDHRLIHTGEKPYQCDKCDYRASKKGNLDAHKIDKHGDFGGNKNYICAMCNKQFTTMGRVRRHMEIMHAEGKEESARVRRQRQKLAQATAAQGIGLPGAMAAAGHSQHRFKRQREVEEAARPAVVHMVPVVQQQVVAGGQAVHHAVQQDEQDAAVQFLESDLYH